MRLSKLKKGERGLVVSLHNDEIFKRRLLDMGITRNVTVTIKKIAPFGDPISIELRGYELCLRKSDLDNIEVMKLWK